MTDPQKECTCTPRQTQRYRSKVSGPLLARIDIQIAVPGLRYQELAGKDAGENSDVIRKRVNVARTIQLQRFQNPKFHANTQMGAKEIKRLRGEGRCREVVRDGDQQAWLERASLQPSAESGTDDRRSRRI